MIAVIVRGQLLKCQDSVALTETCLALLPHEGLTRRAKSGHLGDRIPAARGPLHRLAELSSALTDEPKPSLRRVSLRYWPWCARSVGRVRIQNRAKYAYVHLARRCEDWPKWLNRVLRSTAPQTPISPSNSAGRRLLTLRTRSRRRSNSSTRCWRQACRRTAFLVEAKGRRSGRVGKSNFVCIASVNLSAREFFR